MTPGKEMISNPIQSPDGQWIIYGRYSLSDPYDSSMVYLLDVKNPGAPTPVGKGEPLQWIDEKTFLGYKAPVMSTWLYSIGGGELQQFFEDSTEAISLQEGEYIGYADNRSRRQGWWISSAPGAKDRLLPSPRQLVPSGVYGKFDKSGRYFYWVKNAGELRRISIPSGEEKIIDGMLPGLTSNYSRFDLSYDGKEIVYTDARRVSKLVMIENLFK